MNPAGFIHPTGSPDQRVNTAAAGLAGITERLRRLRLLSLRQYRSVECSMSLFMRSVSACKSVEAMQRQSYQELLRISAPPISPKPPQKVSIHVMQEERRGDHTLYRCSCGCWSKILNGHGMHQWKRARQSFDAHVPRKIKTDSA